jgi:hypothetical protein
MLDLAIQSAQTNLFFIGIMMLILNIGSRHIVHEFSHGDEEYRQNILLRRIAIFAACFVGTRDIVVSLVLTAAFVVLATGIYHAKSVYAREGMTNAQMQVNGVAQVIAGLD